MKKGRALAQRKPAPPKRAADAELLSLEDWQTPLTHFSRATGLMLALFDAGGVLRAGPFTGNPLGEALLQRGAWKKPRGMCIVAAQELTARCIAESKIVDTTLCDVLSAMAIPVRAKSGTVGAIVAGWMFTNFPEPVSTNRLALALEQSFPETWQLVRQVSPMSREKLALYADLLQMLADLFVKHRADTEEKFQLIDDLKGQQADLERAARVRDELFAVVSHELRTPLTPVLGWIPLIREALEEGRLEQVREGIDTIERNAQQESDLIEEMLDLSRILTGRIVFSPRYVAPAQIIAQAAPAAFSLLRDRGLGIHTEIGERMPTVWADPKRLLQMLANLISNAVKFTPDGGLITLGARAVNDSVEFFVADTGIGVKPESASVIFERFQQADSGTHRRYGGLGIGLSVVKSLAEMQGGAIRVESAGEDSGATFIITFPASDGVEASTPHHGAVAVPETNQPATPNRREFHLLVVDDATDTLDLLRRLLARAGYQVTIASTADAAIAAAHVHRPDVLVSDLGMPKVDGFELLRRLNEEFAPEPIPAIAVSGFTGQSERATAEESGFSAYITKPLDFAELVKAIDQVTCSPHGDHRAQTAAQPPGAAPVIPARHVG